jgi:hypothetical protein
MRFLECVDMMRMLKELTDFLGRIDYGLLTLIMSTCFIMHVL